MMDHIDAMEVFVGARDESSTVGAGRSLATRWFNSAKAIHAPLP